MTEIAEPSAELAFSAPEAKDRLQQTLPSNIALVLNDLVERKAWGERTPSGSILYVDINDNPSKGTVIDGKTLKKTGELDLEQKRKEKQIAAAVIVTGPLTQETSKPIVTTLENIFRRLNIQKGNKKKEIKDSYGFKTVRVLPYSGIVIVVEQKGEDINPEWRENLMEEKKLVRTRVSIGQANDPIIWEAGRRRQSEAEEKDAMKTQAGFRIKDDTARNTNAAVRQGFEVDDRVLKEDIGATRMIPITMRRATDFRGVTLRNRVTGESLGRDKRGNDYPSIVLNRVLREADEAGREEQQRVDAMRKANRNTEKPNTPKPDLSIKNAIENPGRSFTSDRFTCPKYHPDYPVYLFRNVESVNGVNILFNSCPTHGVISKGIAPRPEK